MSFKELPPEINHAIGDLTNDQVFQNRFATDKILDELDDELHVDAFTDLTATLNFKLRYNGKTYNNITPLMWAYLWCTESPLLRTLKGEPSQADVDLFFYMLENGVKDVELKDILLESKDFCSKNGILVDDAIEVAHIAVSKAFAPLRMFPHSSDVKASTEPVFDSDWLTALVAKVHTVTGLNVNEIMSGMSLTACCYYYAQYARMQGTQNIEKRPSEEILVAKNNRMCEMILDRFEELNIIKHEQRAEFYKTMTSPPAK